MIRIEESRRRMFSGIRNASVIYALCAVFAVLSFMMSVKPAWAQSARAAIVVEVNGDVSVQRAGGSRSYTVYEEMSLNQGDLISTGASSSVVLSLADHDDEITVGENADVYISDLAEQGNGKISKIKLWAGSAWMKVKSLVSSEDEFEVETPTAVMGVRGTLLFTSVDRTTGETTLAVGSGVVRATTTTPGPDGGSGDAGQMQHSVLVYPAQQFTADTRSTGSDLRLQVGTVDIGHIVSTASPSVIEAMIRNTLETQRENEQIRQKLLDDLNKGLQKPDEPSILKFKDQADLDKAADNFDRFIPNLAKEAVDRKKIERQVIDEANSRIEDQFKKIDLNNVPSLDKVSGMDPEVEKLKEQAAQEQLRYVKEQEQIQINKEKLGDLLQRLEHERSQLEEANKQAWTEQNQKLMEQFVSGLSPEEQKRFEAARKANEAKGASASATTVTTGGGSGHKSSGSNGGGTVTPPAVTEPPVLISPTAAVTTSDPAVVLKAPAAALIKIWNNGTLIAQANGNGEQEVRIPLSSLGAAGGIAVYDKLTATSELGGVQSTAVAIPAITVDRSSGIILTSATRNNQSVNATLSMKNLTGPQAFYGVEVHLVYDNRLSYQGDGHVSKDLNTVFGAQPQSVELLKQTSGSADSELIYAAMLYSGAAGSPSPLEVHGEQQLVSIPLVWNGTSADQLNVKLVSYKVVDKAGNVVREMSPSEAPIVIPVN